LIVGGLTFAYAAIFAALQIMLGVSTPVSLVILRDVVIKGLLGTILALAVYPLLRRILRPALIDDPRAGRRAPVRAGVLRRRAPWRRARSTARRGRVIGAGAGPGRSG
jgi:hypothetical protein